MRLWHETQRTSCLLVLASSVGVMGCAAPRSFTSNEGGSKPVRAATAGQLDRLLAVTIDDLPWFSGLAPGDSPAEANRRLLAEFSMRRLHATGFVVCGSAETHSDVLEAWLAGGMELGNHTAHHLDLNSTSLAAWVDDVEECHEHLSRMRHPRYFRYPMLHQGDTREKRDGAAAALKRLGYTVAHVTVDNSEWVLAAAYGRALHQGDAELRDRIAQAYVQHLMSGIDHFDEVGRAEFGRWPSHVLLLHANALTADHIGAVLDALSSRGIRVVPLAQVLVDPVFSVDDAYVGPKGLSWFYRASTDAFERWGAWDETEAERIRATFP